MFVGQYPEIFVGDESVERLRVDSRIFVELIFVELRPEVPIFVELRPEVPIFVEMIFVKL
jgi:hypothetical protein